MLHDQQGYQVVDRTLPLVSEIIYVNTRAQEVNQLVKKCKRCDIVRVPYIDPKVKQGLITANDPYNWLCIDFTKRDPSKIGKEFVLGIRDTLSKFSVTVVAPDQKAKTVVKPLLKGGCITMAFHQESITTKERVLTTV